MLSHLVTSMSNLDTLMFSPGHPQCAAMFSHVVTWMGNPDTLVFSRSAYPDRRQFTILVDNEAIMHTDQAKATLKAAGIKVLPNWPAHSPDMNPQENVWPRVEDKLRREGPARETQKAFKARALRHLRGVTADSCPNYVKSMLGRIEDTIARDGAMGRH